MPATRWGGLTTAHPTACQVANGEQVRAVMGLAMRAPVSVFGAGFGKKDTLREVVLENVEKGAIVSTDELMSYGLLTPDGYKHGSVNHSAKELAYYDYRHKVVHSTNQVENFWRLFNSITSTHINVSAKYMHRYLTEFSFRQNHRQIGNAMFDLLIAHVGRSC
jgi:hypothetical protein